MTEPFRNSGGKIASMCCTFQKYDAVKFSQESATSNNESPVKEMEMKNVSCWVFAFLPIRIFSFIKVKLSSVRHENDRKIKITPNLTVHFFHLYKAQTCLQAHAICM